MLAAQAQALRPTLASSSRWSAQHTTAPSARGAADWRQRRRCRRLGTQPAAALGGLGTQQLEGPLLGLLELFGYTGEDPAHWNFSPEWYGTQGGGWGRDAGAVVFSAESGCGNGRVSVTAHPATGQPSNSPRSGGSNSSDNSSSGDSGGSGQESWEEWRVLRFNDVTRQTVMRCTVTPASGSGSSSSNGGSSSSGSGSGSSSNGGSGSGQALTVVAQPDCLAQEYLKTTAAVTAALLGLQRLLPVQGQGSSEQQQAAGQHQWQEPKRLRVLCIGVGGGSLPLFLAHHFPSMDIDAVELDPAVVAAATQAMGLPTNLPNLHLHCADAAAFLRQQQPQGQQAGKQRQQQQQGQQAGEQRQQQHYDLVFMDAFDGEDNVPAALCTPGFAALVAAVLHPAHGTFLLNLHSVEEASDPQGPAAVFAAALLGAGSNGTSSGTAAASTASGSSFAVAAQRQRNACVAVARGLSLPADKAAARRWLFFEAVRVAEAAGYRFPAGSRACRNLLPL